MQQQFHMCYKDLTYYSEDHFENAQNIGWLDEAKEFPRAKPSLEFIDALYHYTQFPFNKQRHAHSISLNYKGNELRLGYSEIRVLSHKSDFKFAAPDMIFKYVLEDEYSPPEAFQKAVIEGPKPNTMEYDQFIKRYNEECLWGERPEYVEKCKHLKKAIVEQKNTLIQNWINHHEISINIVTIEGSLLNHALLNNNIDLAFYVIDKGININNFNGIELNTAISQDHNEIVQLLINKKIQFNMSSPQLNPLFTAIKTKNIDAIEILIKSDIDQKVKYSNEFMRSMDALLFAQQLKFYPAVECLKK